MTFNASRRLLVSHPWNELGPERSADVPLHSVRRHNVCDDDDDDCKAKVSLSVE